MTRGAKVTTPKRVASYLAYLYCNIFTGSYWIFSVPFSSCLKSRHRISNTISMDSERRFELRKIILQLKLTSRWRLLSDIWKPFNWLLLFFLFYIWNFNCHLRLLFFNFFFFLALFSDFDSWCFWFFFCGFFIYFTRIDFYQGFIRFLFCLFSELSS